MVLVRMTIHVESCQKIQETILYDVCVASRKRYLGYRGITPVLSPRVYDTVRYMGLYQAGAGDGASPPGRYPVGIYKRYKRGQSSGLSPLFVSRGHAPPAGRLRSVAPCAACGGRRSLTGSRRCPRSMTPITGAARPRLRAAAPGCISGSSSRLHLRQQRVTIAALAGHACRSCGTGPLGRAAAAPPTGRRVGLW